MILKPLLTALAFAGMLAVSAPATAQDPENRTQSRMKGMDSDGNGAVGLAEFTEYRRGWSSKRDDAEMQMRPDNIKKAFDRIDTNRDGSISFDELLVNTKAIQALK